MTAILFAREDSIYKTLPGLDVYDIVRDARTFTGACPIVAHPPCRGWGRLRWNVRDITRDELELGLLAIDRARMNGGVVEHPKGSRLFPTCGISAPGEGYDSAGGFTIDVDQYHWGHRAKKPTRLYIVGLQGGKTRLPRQPYRDGIPLYAVGNANWARSLPKEEREHTPIAFARWLVAIARRCKPRVRTNGIVVESFYPHNLNAMFGRDLP